MQQSEMKADFSWSQGIGTKLTIVMVLMTMVCFTSMLRAKSSVAVFDCSVGCLTNIVGYMHGTHVPVILGSRYHTYHNKPFGGGSLQLY